MKKIQTKVYTFDELSDDSKEKARDWYREGNDMPMLASHLCNLVGEELDARGYTYGGNQETDIDVFYSLSNSQGDGLSFAATVYKDEKTYKVTQSGNYTHIYTMDAVEVLEDGSDAEAPAILKEMRDVAKKIERAGYDEIEYENSAEYIDEILADTEYTFTEDGKRFG